MVERIPQHRHCAECGKAIVGPDKYCSEECKSGHNTRVQASKRKLLMLYIGSFIVFAILIIMSFVRF